MTSQAKDLANLLKRIDRLERAYRRWRLTALFSGLLAVVGVAVAQAKSQQATTPILRGSGFVLVNHVGDEVASFGLVDHLPALSFLDGTGQPMTQLTATSLEIRSYDPAYGRAKLGVDGLSITGKQRQGVQETPAVLISTESGPSLRMAGDTPSMELTNLQQRIVLRSGGGGVPITAWRGAGSPSIELSDHRTKSKVVLGRMLSTSGASGDVQQIEDTGIGAISLLDDAGTPRLQLLGGSYPTLAVLDDAGHFRALFGRTLPFDSYSSEPPYTATVRGAAGAMEWQAPPPGQPAQK